MAGFVTTRWTLVQQAADLSHPDAAAALEHLCRVYWPAIYLYVRQKGFGPPEAADLTQEFFTRILEKRYFDQARRERGTFRTFLLRSEEHTSELQSRQYLVCRPLLEKKKKIYPTCSSGNAKIIHKPTPA